MILLFVLAVLLVVLSIYYPNAELIGLGLVFVFIVFVKLVKRIQNTPFWFSGLPSL